MGRIVEAALRDPPAQRHLAALKTRAPRIALARFLAFVAFPGRPAELRAHPAAHAHLAVPRSRGGFKFERFTAMVPSIFSAVYSSTTTRCLTSGSFRTAGVSSRSTPAAWAKSQTAMVARCLSGSQ